MFLAISCGLHAAAGAAAVSEPWYTVCCSSSSSQLAAAHTAGALSHSSPHEPTGSQGVQAVGSTPPTCAVPVCEAYSTTISLAGALADAALAARCARRRARMAAPPVAAAGPGAAAGGPLAAAAGAAGAGAAVLPLTAGLAGAAAAGAALAGAALAGAAAAVEAAARWALKRARMAAPPAAGAAGAAGAGTLACALESPCTQQQKESIWVSTATEGKSVALQRLAAAAAAGQRQSQEPNAHLGWHRCS